MSETSAPSSRPPMETAHEAYSFACLNCGYGWEQAYEIEHAVDVNGRMVYRYRANGVPVPSPLTHPSCPGCGGEHVRIMAAGRVASAVASWSAAQAAAPATPRPPREPRHPRAAAKATSGEKAAEVNAEGNAEGVEGPTPLAPAEPRPRRRLHLPFHWHLRRRHG
ncbi:hypothetical protein [Streptacidiphilus fuscans]|uniref:Uncharacterized protein n=1 Tax=Streptacidiphilus fuscans TaxID=2789292 RepID=A0A931BDW3_9ACTN|nr:hypothetical protein [Streptacidiphilus fuscans]MBF9071640.1 hypothetical protein [Streptacidiphilus fuscans]MBF9072873.1 hypothetical protein [Streptacidiphilus fuscans]